jgi:hypothetical protein
MAEEKRDEGAGDPIKLFFFEEDLARQRNEMMDNFYHILRHKPTTDTSSSSNHFGGAAPFKVQVSFDIPLFEGQIDANALDKWLNPLEGYFSDRENFTFVLLKAAPHVKDWWETYCEKKAIEESAMFVVVPTCGSFKDAIKKQYYLVGSYNN